MRRTTFWTLVLLAFSVGSVSVANGQEGRPVGERPEASARRTQPAEPESPATRGVTAQGNQAAAPRLVKVSGMLTEFVRNSVSSSVEMTFAVYKDEVGGEALWTETQAVEVDKEGRYTVLLGTAQADGVPLELFPAGEPRWLGVEIRGQAPQARTLLVSVPYALKALDAEKLSGKSLSDFVLSDSLGDQVRRVVEGQTMVANQATSTGTAQPGQTKASSTSTAATTAAGPMFPPSTFSGTNATQIVSVQQNGSGNGLYAQTASSGGSSVFAVANATTGSASGVTGVTNSGGAGVIGVTNAASPGANGVYGKSVSTGGSGVFGDATASSGFTRGVLGQTASPDGQGVFGFAYAASGFNIGIRGDSLSTEGIGVAGYADANSGPANGVLGQSVSPNGTGVFGVGNATTGFASGVVGVTNSPGGAGVIGVTNAASPGANGVYGKSVSTGGSGVFGDATASSGFTRGVLGQTASPDGNGVFGVAHAPSGFTTGTGGDASASPNGTGVFGSTVQWVGVGGQATASSGTPAYGVWGDTASTSGAGIIGFADATSGYSYGAAGNNASINGIGVFGNATATSGFPSGVYGVTISPNGNGAVGYAGSTSGFPTAVVGFLNSNDGGIAGEFIAHGGKGLILQGLSGPNFNQVFSVDANGNLYIAGNLYVAGTKSSTAKLQNSREVALYAVESPENWFEDFGSAELSNGVAWVPLDASFAQTANPTLVYHVFLTANGDSNGLYISRKTAAGFEVREHGGGASNVGFDYRIVARRRGYETVRLGEVQRDVKTAESSREHLVALANSGSPRKLVVVKAPSIVPAHIAPAIRPLPPRPIVPSPPKPNIPQPPGARQ